MRIASLFTLLALATTTTVASARNATETTSTINRIAMRRYYRMRGVDVVGKDTTTAERKGADACLYACMAQSHTTTNACSAVTWTTYNGGTCWLKATEFKGTPTVPKADAVSFFTLDNAVLTSVWSGTSENVDIVGNDLATTRQKFMQNCRSDCDKNTECYAVVWTNYNDGTCWLKRQASGYVPKAGALSAYVAREYQILT